MAESSTKTISPPPDALHGPDDLSVKLWLALYAVYLAAMAVPAAILLARMDVGWGELFGDPVAFAEAAPQELKWLILLIFAIYISLCCTFLPLPTGMMVSAVSLQQVAPSQSVWLTTAIVASIGAGASTMANLHDFHLFTWMLRHHWISRIRHSRLYDHSGRWFSRQPFMILVIFNVIPIPIDVIRMLAATYRYRLDRFAMANFVGRWIRYAVLAFVTFQLGQRGWVVVIVLLGVALVLGAGRFGIHIGQRLASRGAGQAGGQAGQSTKEKET